MGQWGIVEVERTLLGLNANHLNEGEILEFP